jgi:2-polyprenyl-3-methyl-5-hydroxy-6-metoxy-1,4-benzoquinol methylase
MALPNNCPLCNGTIEFQSVVTRHVYSDERDRSAFYHCEKCDVRYQFPGLTMEEELQFYIAEFETFMTGRAGEKGGWNKAEDHISSNEGTRQRRMKYIAPHLAESCNILEVGCSSGFMLWPLQKVGHQCSGVEPSGLFSDFVRSNGIDVSNSIDDLSITNIQYDIILHFFVLEHISTPFSFLRKQLALLKTGGKIIFEVPNVADPLYSVYDIPAFERFYWSVAHPWYFSKKSLHYILQKLPCSYEVFGDQRYDLSNHMVWARDGKPGGMHRFTAKLGAEFEEVYKQSLIKTGLCDTLVAVIEKS